MLTLTDLLHATERLQRESFGVDVPHLEGEKWAAYVRDNVLAAQVELSEFIQELAWKPWKDGNGRPSPEVRKRAVVELVDALHFWLNLALALDCSGPELVAAYGEKHRTNAKRQAQRHQSDCACVTAGAFDALDFCGACT